MKFLSRVFGLDTNGSRARQADRSPRRRRAQFGLESLEGRDLKSNVPGVDLVYGEVQIQATQYAGNSASVTINPQNGNVDVTLNGQTAEFNRSDVYDICYKGGLGGGDTFANYTNYGDTIRVFTGNNTVIGSSGYNVAYLWGDDNTFVSQGSTSYVFAYNGDHDNIDRSGSVSVYAQDFPPEWLQWLQG
jgi:hypothetical protein